MQFDGLILFKAYKVLDEKVHKSYVSWQWRVIHKEKLILEKYTFFCDATGLKQSVEGTLAGNSLTTVLNEVHFLVNLYSFPYPWSPRQTLHQGQPFAPSQAEQLAKLPHPRLFVLTPLFWAYFQVKINKMVGSLDYHPCPSRLASTINPLYFYKLPRVLSLFRMLVEFSLKFLYSTMWEIFQIYGAHIPRKCIDSRYFYSCFTPLKTRSQVLTIVLRQKKITHSHRKYSFENLFPLTVE